MRKFKTKIFSKLSKDMGLADALLIGAANEVAEGLVEARLGGNLYKKRIALPGKGKRGSARAILVYAEVKDCLYFVYAFKKSEKSSLSRIELAAFRKLDKIYSDFHETDIEKLIAVKELEELTSQDEENEENKEARKLE